MSKKLLFTFFQQIVSVPMVGIVLFYFLWCSIWGFLIPYFSNKTIIFALVAPIVLYFVCIGLMGAIRLCRFRIMMQIYALRKIAIYRYAGMFILYGCSNAHRVLCSIIKNELYEINESNVPYIFLQMMKHDSIHALFVEYDELLHEKYRRIMPDKSLLKPNSHEDHDRLKAIEYEFKCKMDVLNHRHERFLKTLPRCMRDTLNTCVKSDIQKIKTSDQQYICRVRDEFIRERKRNRNK